MRTNTDALKGYTVPTLPGIPETVKDKLTREGLAEAGLVAATVAVLLVLATALRLGLENYVIAGM